MSIEQQNYIYRFDSRERKKGKGTERKLQLIHTTASQLDFVITREGHSDNFAKNIALAEEIQTGDADFDRSFYIDSESPQFVKALFSDPNNREVIKIIFSYNIKKIYLKKGKLITLWEDTEAIRMNQDPEKMKSAATTVNLLFDKINELSPHYKPDLAKRRKRYTGYAIVAFLCGLAVIELIISRSIFPLLNGNKAFVFSLQYSLIGFLLIAAFLHYFLKGRSSSHKELLLALPLTLIALIFLGFSTVEIVNGALDKSTEESHNLRVLNKYTSKGKNNKGTKYKLKTEPVFSADENNIFEVNFSDYNRAVENQSVYKVVVKKGHLGFPWVVEKKLN